MAFISAIMRAVISKRLLLLLSGALLSISSHAAAPCAAGTLYLTFDTGHMGPATAIADLLDRHHIKATFFIASEKTLDGGTTLDDTQKAFWQRLARAGHSFGSHTWAHHYFRSDVGSDRVHYVPYGQKNDAGHSLNQAALCEELRRPEQRFRELTGQGFNHIWRAPGGKTTPRVVDYAAQCGFKHVAWSDAGFLGDELDSTRYPNDLLLKQAVTRLRDGDVMMMHLGIWSRKDPFWPTLEPLLTQLQNKGFCFAPITEQTPLKGRLMQP